MAFNNFYIPNYADEDPHFYPYSFNSFQHSFDSSYSSTHPTEVIPSPASYDPFYSEPIIDSSPVGYPDLLHYEAFQYTNEYDHPYYYNAAFPSTFDTTPNFRVSHSESASSNGKIVTLYDKAPESHTVQTGFHRLSDEDFKELDPTPYGGGYDIVSTYGRPLPHSDATCYPRSQRENRTPVAPKRVTFSLPPAPVDEGNRALLPPISDDNREDKPKMEENRALPPLISVGNRGDEPIKEEAQAPPLLITDGNREDKPKEVGQMGVGAVDGRTDGRDMEAPNYMPYGYGMESVDICETIFGPWPCLNPNLRRGCCCHYHGGYSRERYGNPWSRAADYLFGDPNPYSYSYGNSYLNR